MENNEELLRIVFEKNKTEGTYAPHCVLFSFYRIINWFFADLEDQFKQLNITSNDIGLYLQHLTSFGLNKLSMKKLSYFSYKN